MRKATEKNSEYKSETKWEQKSSEMKKLDFAYENAWNKEKRLKIKNEIQKKMKNKRKHEKYKKKKNQNERKQNDKKKPAKMIKQSTSSIRSRAQYNWMHAKDQSSRMWNMCWCIFRWQYKFSRLCASGQFICEAKAPTQADFGLLIFD